MSAKGSVPHNKLFTDEELIESHKKHGGHRVKMAEELGVLERQIYVRLSKLQGKGILLKAGSQHSSLASISYHNAFFKTNIENGIVLIGTDPHYWPGEKTTVQRAFVHFVKHMEPRPKVIVLNGDVFDGSRISRFGRVGFLESERPTVQQEIEVCQERLDEIEDAAPRGVRFVWPLGNHDMRFEAALAAAVPEFEGVQGFALKDRFPRWQPCWSFWVNENQPGWTEIKHRFRGGIHSTYNNTLKAGVSLVTGHLHSMKVYPYTDRRGTRFGVDAGTMADVDGDNIGSQFVHYLEANPVDWRSGFIILTFKNGRLLWPEVVHKFEEGVVEFRGNLIEV